MSIGHDRPAFPTPRLDGAVEDGLTIRDYFAAKAMEAIVGSFVPELTKLPADAVMNSGLDNDAFAKLAYGMADAMLRERSA